MESFDYLFITQLGDQSASRLLGWLVNYE